MSSDTPERRRAPRWLCASIVQVEVSSGKSKGVYAAVVEDISETGIGIAMDGELPIEGPVVVSDSEHSIAGRIRHCTLRKPGEYHVGIQFSPDFRWCSGDEWPPHKLNVEEWQERAVDTSPIPNTVDSDVSRLAESIAAEETRARQGGSDKSSPSDKGRTPAPSSLDGDRGDRQT